MIVVVVLVSILLALIITARKTAGETRLSLSIYRCAQCHYPQLGISSANPCPECGTSRWVEAPARPSVVQWTHRLAVAAIGPFALSVLATSLYLLYHRPADLVLVLAIVNAPMCVLSLAHIFQDRFGRGRRSTSHLKAFGTTYGVAISAVMIAYWGNQPSGDDYGWPLTNVVFCAVVGVLVACVMVASRWLRRL